jgi:hypothetical protein
MRSMSTRALAVARPVIQVLTVVNILYVIGLALLFVFSFFVDGWPARPLGFDTVHAHPQIGNGLRAIVLLGILAAAIVYGVLRHLLAIVDSVRDGDPFVLDNARRLDAIAWRTAALEGIRLVILAIAALVWERGRLGSFTIAPWLAVLMLFVLAGVFAQGARMRADLDGTV